MRLLAVALLVGALSGCGGASAEVRAAYGEEILRCMRNELAIRDRAGTTEEEDRADLARERERCATALRHVEGGR